MKIAELRISQTFSFDNEPVWDQAMARQQSDDDGCFISALNRYSVGPLGTDVGPSF